MVEEKIILIDGIRYHADRPSNCTLLEQRIVIISPSHRKKGQSVKVADMDLAAALAQAFAG